MGILDSMNGALENVVGGAAGALDYASDTVTNTFGLDDMYTPAVSQGSDRSASRDANFLDTALREGLNFLNSDLKDNFDTAKSFGKGIVTVVKGGSGVGLAMTAGSWVGGKLGGMAGSALIDAVVGDEFFGYTKVKDGNKPVRKDDPIFHKNCDWANMGGVAGSILGAVAAIGVFALLTASSIACPALVAVFLAAGAGAFVKGLVGSCASSLSQYGEKKGEIKSGAPTVTFEGKPVARVKDLVECEEHSGPQRIAEGVTTVSACGELIARLGHRTECDANVQGGCDTISIDENNTSVVLDIHPNESLAWMFANTFIDELLPGPDYDQAVSKGNKSNSSDGDGSKSNKSNSSDGDGSKSNKPNSSDGDGSKNNKANSSDGDGSKNNKPNSSDGEASKNNKPNSSDGEGSKNNKLNPSGGDAHKDNTAHQVPPKNDAHKDNTAHQAPPKNDAHQDNTTHQAPPKNDEHVPPPTNRDKQATESATKNGTETENTCTNGDPVDMATGDFIQSWQVVSLPQDVLLLNLNRLYRSTAKCKGLFGDKWADDWSQYIEINQKKSEVIYYNGEGVAYTYHTPQNDVCAINLHAPQNILYGQQTHYLYLLNRREMRIYVFEHIKNAPLNRRYLTWVIDYFGNSIHFEYQDMNLQTVTHSAGYKLKISSYRGLIERIDYVSADIQQRLLTCEYNDKNQLIRCNSHQFGDIYHEYDENGLMTSWKDTQKTHTKVSYDEKGRVSSTQTVSGHYKDHFEYDEENCCTIYTDAEGGVSYYWYNKDNLIIKIEDALGRVTETNWNLSNKISEIDALGRKISYAYNKIGELTEVRLPTGKRFRYSYNCQGLLIEAINAQGKKWKYNYTDKGALVSSISPNGFEWRYHHDEKGRLIRTTYPDGNYTIYNYDERKRQLKSYCDSRGNRTSFEVDIFGRPLSVILTDKSLYRYEYSQSHANPNGSLTKLITPEGSIQTFAYNSEHLLTESVDGNGNKTQYTYGAFDLLESKTLPNGETLTFHYDKLTRLTEVKNAQGDSYCYEYDKAGQLVRETDFTGRSRAYAYDAVGRLIRKMQADGHVETYAYDIEDKLLTRNTWQPVLQENDICRYELAHQVCYTYTNKTGQLSQTINTQYLPYFAQHITEFEYDEQYRLIAEIQDGERIEVELDKYGRQTALLLPNGAESAVKISQGFNQYGELTQFQVNNHNPLNLSYDKLGRQTRKQNQNGFILAEHFSPSGLLQAQGGGWNNSLTEQQLSDYQPNQTYPIAGTQISRKWQYDKAFNLVHTQDNHWGATEYRVNKNGQVTDVLNGLRHSEHYRYDSQLNLTQKAQRETDALGQYQFEAANDASFGMKQRNGRITRFGNKTYKYDELGRLHSKTETKKGFRPVTTYYKWNSQSQLVELHSPFKGSWRYEYDSFGRRITKYQIQTDQPQPNQVINMPIRANQDYWHKINELWAKEEQSQGEKTSQNLTALSGYRYLYKQNQLVAEAPLQINGVEGNLALTQANWADAIYWLYQEDDFTPTARYEKGQLHYTVADQVGTITELLTEDGYIDYRQKLNLWGEAEVDGHRHYAANDSNPLKCNHRFVGQYYDDESELHYNRFRYYSPETGQYISHDPIGLLGGFNPYGYVVNPNVQVDPFGLAPRVPSYNATSLEDDVVRYKPRDVITPQAGHRNTAIKRAWAQEKALIEQTGRGTRPWTQAEMDLIKSTPNGRLRSVMTEAGYTGHHINSVENGALGARWEGDPRNIVFLQNHEHPSGINEHVHSNQGHGGTTRNKTTGRLIDREATLKQRLNQQQSKCP